MKKKFKVFVRGTNYLLRRQDSDARKHGFYTTVFVEARNQEEAEALAIDVIRNDSKILDICKNGLSDLPKLLVESSDEIASFENCRLPRTGLVLYIEEESSKI